MTLAATLTIDSFSGPTALASATVTGATGTVIITYHWDDDLPTTIHTLPSSGGGVSDTATHDYPPWDYFNFPGPGQSQGGAFLHVTDDVISVPITSNIVPLPIPQPFVDVTPSSGPAPLHATITAGQLTAYDPSVSDVQWDWSDTGGWSQTTFVPTVTHTFLAGVYRVFVRVTNSVGWSHRVFDPRVTSQGVPPLRQFPRDDALGGAPRQDRQSQSIQASARQGWLGSYR